MKRDFITSGCGIVGTVNCNISDDVFNTMTDLLKHRGPDARGVWSNNNKSIRLGHRRLAIVGIDERGVQPMTRDGVTIVCNGEIYNYPQLRMELESHGYDFLSDCDIEVLLHAYSQWGVQFLDKINGVFAFAIYDARTNKLLLARDPMGVKPLVYTEVGKGQLIFASEIKCLLVYPSFSRKPNLEAIRSDILHGLLGDKQITWFDNVFNLEPGHLMIIDCKEGTKQVSPFWSYPSAADLTSEDVIVASIREIIDDAIRLQMLSDVGITTTCSGGIDSVVVTNLAATKNGKELDVFSLAYNGEDAAFNTPAKEDLFYARKVAEENPDIKLTVIPVSINNLLTRATIDSLVKSFDGALPLDIRILSFLEMYLQIHNYGAKVVLTGQGADELWMGYYDDVIYTFWKFNQEQMSSEYLAGNFFNRIPMGYAAWNADFLNPKSAFESTMLNLEKNYQNFDTDDVLNKLSRFVIRTHFQSILNMDDKIAMSAALETRVPWVDKRMVELSFRVPGSLKINSPYPDKKPKHLVRQAMNGIVPDYVINRAKAPFPDPKGPYRESLRKLILADATQIKQSPFMREIFSRDFLNGIELDDQKTERNLFITYILWRFGELYFK